MDSTITALAILSGLATWHVHNRRHPSWLASDDGRFAIYSGYLLVTIAAYWLATAPTATGWEWALGNLWALAAMVAFVKGFDSLREAASLHAERAQHLETVQPSTDAIPHRRQ